MCVSMHTQMYIYIERERPIHICFNDRVRVKIIFKPATRYTMMI